MTKRVSIGELIRVARKAQGLSLRAVSELVGVTYQQVQKYEKGGDNISLERLKQLSAALGVPVSSFITASFEAGSVAEAPAAYGKMSDDERLLLQMYRNIKNKKTKKAIFEFIKSLAAKE